MVISVAITLIVQRVGSSRHMLELELHEEQLEKLAVADAYEEARPLL